MNKKINVVLTSSDFYACYTSVTMISILENISTNVDVCFYILTENMSSRSKLMFEDLKKKYHFNLEYIYISAKDLNLPIPKQERVSNIAYARLKIGSLLPNVDKCIVVDSDLVFIDDICKLYNLDIKEKIIGIAKDSIPRGISNMFFESFGIPNNYPYTNSGVLLIDLKKWRENSIEQKLFNNLKQYNEKLVFMDQDLIFITCVKDAYIFDTTWNYLVSNDYREEQDYLKNNAKVLHFGGDNKCWIDLSVDFSEKWWNFAKESPYFIDILLRYFSIQNEKLEKLDNIIKMMEYKRKYALYKIKSRLFFWKKKYQVKKKNLKKNYLG